MATTWRAVPTGTSTRTEAPGDGVLPAWEMRARTTALRVLGSTRESSASTCASIGVFDSVVYTFTCAPLRSDAATCWATVKST